jgi:hypothetical protein
MADQANLKIDVPILNFDVIQGDDMLFSGTYVKSGVDDSMDGASMLMSIWSDLDEDPIDTLSIENGRINVIGVNRFSYSFPGRITDAYKLPVSNVKKTTLFHKFFYSNNGSKRRLFEGTVTFKR